MSIYLPTYLAGVAASLASSSREQCEVTARTGFQRALQGLYSVLLRPAGTCAGCVDPRERESRLGMLLFAAAFEYDVCALSSQVEQVLM